MRRIWQLAAGVLMGVLVGVLGGVLVGGHTSAQAQRAPAAWEPRGDTIVRITGDAANGFGVHHHDGSALFPPTDSEAMAECGEYDAVVERVRCRVAVRTWYRDLGQTKRAIAWARYDAGTR